MEENTEKKPEKKKRKNKSFRKGILVGVIAGILIMVLTGTFSNIILKGGDAKLHVLEDMVKEHYLFGDSGDEEEARNAGYKGYIDSLGDPYSQYMSEDEFDEFSRSIDGEFCGVGIVIARDMEAKGEPPTVVRVMKDNPAEKAGVKAGDRITAVNGKKLTEDDKMDVSVLIKGKEGSRVDVTFYRPETDRDYTVTLTREIIKTETVTSKVLPDGSGYISVMEFAKTTDKDFKKAVDSLISKNVTGLIIDLRNNPGGLMDSCTEMLDYLLPEGTLVSSEYKDGSKDRVTSDEKHQVKLPMAVIVNGMSASASEIFTAAMQDYGKAEIVGTKTFGKGIIQNIYPMTDGSAVKLTIAEYLTPDGRRIHKKGITPDIVVKDSRESVFDDNDRQLDEACKAIKNAE